MDAEREVILFIADVSVLRFSMIGDICWIYWVKCESCDGEGGD